MPPLSTEQHTTTGLSSSLSFGELLRRERQLRGLSLRDAAAVTKVSIRFLEALECNDFDSLPGGAYNKGFLRAYSEFIGLDPEEMVNHYLFEISKGRHETEIAPRAVSGGHREEWLRVVLVAAGLVLLAAVLIWALT